MAHTAYLDTYLAGLPEGMSSFPDCVVKANVLDEVLAWLVEVEAGVPPSLAPAVARVSSDWVPETLINALSLHIADVGYPTGESWVNSVYRRQRALYQTPLYRAVMVVLSPTLLMMGAADRWKAYRRGTALKVDRWQNSAHRRETIGSIRHPAGLYAELNLQSLGQAFLAAVDSCGARDAEVEIIEYAGDATRFRLSYRA
ncbi:MAG: hypothetical protein AB8I08_21320 [Sandaracinaceae bacterium]